MSKPALKKHLLSLTREQLVETILEMYDNMKPVNEYFEYYLNPNEKEMLKRHKTVIQKEFALEWKYAEPKLRFSVARKAIAEFRALKPSPEMLADLMLTLPEVACEFTYNYSDMSEQFYNSAYNNFKAALEFINKNNLLDDFKLRCGDCLKWASVCGYGFADDMRDIYYQYYQT
ncbi:MAG: DUF6155 family protein [Paludibacter sp.]|nr:DUF6155 family protein [Paludibacter sp.]